MKLFKGFLGFPMLVLFLTILSVIAVQAQAWISRNGFSPTGPMPNHFGEPYSTNMVEWILRGFLSPFAWFGIVLIGGGWFFFLVIASILLRVIRRASGLPGKGPQELR